MSRSAALVGSATRWLSSSRTRVDPIATGRFAAANRLADFSHTGVPYMLKTRSDGGAGVVAGIAAGIAYLAEMAVDLKAAGHNTDDVYMLGRIATTNRRFIRPVGLVMHLTNSVI